MEILLVAVSVLAVVIILGFCIGKFLAGWLISLICLVVSAFTVFLIYELFIKKHNHPGTSADIGAGIIVVVILMVCLVFLMTIVVTYMLTSDTMVFQFLVAIYREIKFIR